MIQNSAKKPLTMKQVNLNRQLPTIRVRKNRGWWLLLINLIIVMLCWNWQLVMTTITGVIVMLIVYFLPHWDFNSFLAKIRQFIHSPNSQLILAVSSGAIASLLTYITTGILIHTDNHWIATTMIIQTLATPLMIILLILQLVNNQNTRHTTKLNLLINNLTEPDHLKRLITIKELINLAENKTFTATEKQTIAEYFCLMLTQEQETVIRDALLSGLPMFSNQTLINQTTGQIPLSLR
ncbi:MAG TPA: hypothetical protein V6C58_21565 [Allocoleopsis sp.]